MKCMYATCIECNRIYGYCSSCKPGTWGMDCLNKCSGCECCDSMTGLCLHGCPASIQDGSANTLTMGTYQ